MPSVPAILHFGYDDLLADARAEVLENAGYEFLPLKTRADAIRVFEARPVDMVIICHTVPATEAKLVVAEMKETKPETPIVVVHVGGGLSHPARRQADGFVDGLRGPEHLLTRVDTLLGQARRAIAS